MLIDKTLVNKKSNPYIISEIGLNHNGDFNEAINLINDSKAAKCDAIKFQIRSESFFETSISKSLRTLQKEVFNHCYLLVVFNII